MSLAYVFPQTGLFWSLLEFFLLSAWILALFYVLFDLFQSPYIGGVAKAFWFIFVIVLPVFGIAIYLIARGGAAADRADARALDAGYVAAPPG